MPPFYPHFYNRPVLTPAFPVWTHEKTGPGVSSRACRPFTFPANAGERKRYGRGQSARFDLLKRDNATLILLIDEVGNLLRLKNLNELLRPVCILILLCNSNDVTIGLCSL